DLHVEGHARGVGTRRDLRRLAAFPDGPGDPRDRHPRGCRPGPPRGASGMSAVLAVVNALRTAARGPIRLYHRLRRPHLAPGARRILVAFTRGQLDQTVLDAAIRIARAEPAPLVPASLIVIPMRLPLDADMTQEVGIAMPLLEAVEHAASRAGIPVDARVESGRTPIHALERLWDVERFDRIVI